MTKLRTLLGYSALTLALAACSPKNCSGNTVTPEPPKPFSMSKVLTSSARDYVDSISQNLSNFTMEGVHGGNYEQFISRIPQGTEVVVDYQLNFVTTNGGTFSYQGTALIPRN